MSEEQAGALGYSEAEIAERILVEFRNMRDLPADELGRDDLVDLAIAIASTIAANNRVITAQLRDAGFPLPGDGL